LSCLVRGKIPARVVQQLLIPMFVLPQPGLPAQAKLTLCVKNGCQYSQRLHEPGQLTFNTLPQLLAAVKEGHGLCFVPEDVIQADVDDGHLVKVLEDWSPTFPGYHLYYPSQRQLSAGFQVIVDCLRHSQ
jgi:DNA-binding transcriptional LysR family regulator